MPTPHQDAANPVDADACYRAVAARDPRFDGRFFTGVRTTGIFCRPVCPARTPLRKNCTFFRSAAEAESAGFRPCLRCRPESAPGTPAWSGTSALVARALRRIEGGALAEGDVDTLAARLGIGARHLRRLFREQLGASPVAVERSRRLHFARSLLRQTGLPVTEVALAAGFGSLRRFHAAFRAAYGAPPTALRRGAAAREGAPDRGGELERADRGTLTLELAYRPPFDAAAVFGYLAARAVPGLEEGDATTYRRAIALGEARGVLSVRARPRRRVLSVTVPVAFAPHLAEVAARVRALFDLDADPLRIRAHLTRSPVLRRALAGRSSVRVPGCWDRFELAVRAVLGQQVTVRGAATLAGRLVERCGVPIAADDAGTLHATFPTAGILASIDPAEIGMPRSRARALTALAEAVRDGAVDLDDADPDRARAALVALPGIGDWTAQYVALRALREPDAFPASDLGLRKALATCTDRETLRLAEAWRPWRGYAALALWTAEATAAGPSATSARRAGETTKTTGTSRTKRTGARRATRRSTA